MGFYRFQAALNHVHSKAAHPTLYGLRLLFVKKTKSSLKIRNNF